MSEEIKVEEIVKEEVEVVEEALAEKTVAKVTPKKRASRAPRVLKIVPVMVYNQYNNFVREYSEEVHGKDYEKLAEQFLAKKGREGFIIKNQ